MGCGAHVYHYVEPGETLYSIGWLYGYDHKELARWNGIRPPYAINPGQRLQVAPIQDDGGYLYPKTQIVEAKESQRVSRESLEDDTEQTGAIIWQWPASGRTINLFDDHKTKKKGIDIMGQLGQPVYSAAPGRVVYTGHGIVGYGELIIVKHNQTYLSAYAHNNEVLVKEGDRINSGQIIAKMGNSGTSDTRLHFQIRRDGKPVNPIQYLPKLRP
jgi:lipoprotein NlpD